MMVRRVLGLCALSLAVLLLAGPAGGENPYSKKASVDAKLASVQAKIAELQAREGPLRDEIAGYTSQIRGLERQIGTVEGRLEPLQQDLDLHEKRLASLNELFRLQTERLTFLRDQYRIALTRLNRRLVGIYENGQPGTLEIILSSRSLTAIIDQIEFLRLLAREDHAIAKEVRDARDEERAARAHTKLTRGRVRTITRVIAVRTAQVRQVRDQLALSRSKVAGIRGERQSSLDNLTAEERGERSEAEALQKTSAEIAAKIRAAESSGIVSSVGSGTSPSAAGLVWPVSGPVTSPFGMRWGRMHEGVDIGVGYGTPIHAAAAGVVVWAGWEGGYGNLVVVDHGGGLSTAYGHQERIAVSYGQHVGQGEVVGYVGCTGHCFGPHLHFEVRINGSAVDPLGYL
jgi:murein DD-endopeptidase MepM/ murein hydrolase activator NlpD